VESDKKNSEVTDTVAAAAVDIAGNQIEEAEDS
jgi:hypothetical protein